MPRVRWLGAMATRDPRIDRYIRAAEPFAQPVLGQVRKIVHDACPQVEETIKWGMPCFTYGGRILAHVAAFKTHCAFGFWHGEQVVGSRGRRDAMGQFGRIESIGDLPPARTLEAMVRKAVRLIDAGVKPRMRTGAARKPPPKLPDDLRQGLAKNPAARRHYAALSSSRQREYVDWINEAKRAATRERRLATAIAWLSEGKPLGWKYLG